MRHWVKISAALVGGAAAIWTSGCSDGNGSVVGGTSATSAVVNNGSLPTSIVNGGVPLNSNFICTTSAVGKGVNAVIGANGLVGGALNGLLGQLGLDQVAALLSSVAAPDAAIDGNLDTFSAVTLAVGTLGPLVNSVDESIVFSPQSAFGAGTFAVFGLSFPSGIANASVFNLLRVRTFLNDNEQESNVVTRRTLSVLGLGPEPAMYFGLQANKPFNRVTFTVEPDLLTANLGPVVNVHELCLGGTLVAKPAS